MASKYLSAAILAAACALAACGTHGGSGAALPPQGIQQQTATAVLATPTPTPTPLLIHTGFNHAEHTDPVFGPVWYYAPKFVSSALVIRVRHGSRVQFINDDPSGTSHTAAGFGSTAFPRSFDNTHRFTRSGTTLNGSLTWSTGILNHGGRSQIFTVGPVGHYFFGCGFHYTTKPTTTNGSMGDVLVST